MDSNDKLGAIGKGRYQLHALLGKGGMGRVYRARDHRLKRDVVIKIPDGTSADWAGIVKRFERELRALILLAHPHIVPIIDVGRHEGVPFAVMSLLAGGSLRDQLDKVALTFRPNHVGSLHAWLPAIAAALDHAHQQGFLHRDVKSANILFDEKGKAYLSDFGVTKPLPGADPVGDEIGTAQGQILGTPGYLAPEKLVGKPGDARSDQFALAVTVYEALADESPFRYMGPAEVVRRLGASEISLAAMRPDAPGTLVAAVKRAFSLDPGGRFATCADFAAAALAEVSADGAAAPDLASLRPAAATKALTTGPALPTEAPSTGEPAPALPSRRVGWRRLLAGAAVLAAALAVVVFRRPR